MLSIPIGFAIALLSYIVGLIFSNNMGQAISDEFAFLYGTSSSSGNIFASPLNAMLFFIRVALPFLLALTNLILFIIHKAKGKDEFPLAKLRKVFNIIFIVVVALSEVYSLISLFIVLTTANLSESNVMDPRLLLTISALFGAITTAGLIVNYVGGIKFDRSI